MMIAVKCPKCGVLANKKDVQKGRCHFAGGKGEFITRSKFAVKRPVRN